MTQVRLNASVIFSRIAATAGMTPASTPINTISPMPITISRGGSTKIGSMPLVGSPSCTIEPRDAEAEQPARERNEQRFGKDERQNRRARKAQRLQHGKLARALANRLRHRARRDQAEHEQHRRRDRDHDAADVADLLREPFDEPLLGRRLRLGRRIREHLVERPARDRRPAPGRKS